MVSNRLICMTQRIISSQRSQEAIMPSVILYQEKTLYSLVPHKSLKLKAILIISALIWTFTAFQSSETQGDTLVDGLISSDTVWTVGQSPYVLTGTVIVAEGVSLVIEAGVEVRAQVVDQPVGIYVEGSLIISGNSSNPVIFVPDGALSVGAWQGIQVNRTGEAVITNAVISFAKIGLDLIGNCLDPQSGPEMKAAIFNSTIRFSEYAGTGAGCARNVLIENSTLEDNEQFGIRVENSEKLTISNTTVTSSETGVYVLSSSDLTIVNSTIYNNSKSGFSVGISLSLSENITIAGSNISDQRPTLGDGIGIRINLCTDVVVHNSTISGNRVAGIGVSNSDFVTIRDNVVSHNGITGVGVGVNTIVVGNRISENRIGVSCTAAYGPEDWPSAIEGNSIFNNTEWGITMNGGRAALGENLFHNNGRDGQGGNVVQRWYVIVRVERTDGKPVESWSLRVEDSHGLQYGPGSSLTSDFFRATVVEYQILGDGRNVSRNPYRISVSANGYNEQRELYVEENLDLTFTIDSSTALPEWVLPTIIITVVILLVALLLIRRRRSKGVGRDKT